LGAAALPAPLSTRRRRSGVGPPLSRAGERGAAGRRRIPDARFPGERFIPRRPGEPYRFSPRHTIAEALPTGA